MAGSEPCFYCFCCYRGDVFTLGDLGEHRLGVASVDKDHMNVARVLKLTIPSTFDQNHSSFFLAFGLRWYAYLSWCWLDGADRCRMDFQLPRFGKYTFATPITPVLLNPLLMMFVAVFVVGAIGLILDRIMIIFQRLASFEGGCGCGLVATAFQNREEHDHVLILK